MIRAARLTTGSGKLLCGFRQRQARNIGPIMTQEELYRFPQSRRFAQLTDGLRVLFHGEMQREAGCENTPCRKEAFQLGGCHRFDGVRVI